MIQLHTKFSSQFMNMITKIVLIISSLDTGGAERVLSELANYLVAKNYDITLIIFEENQKKPFYFLDKKIKITSLGLKKSNHFFTKLFYLFKCIFKLRLILKKNHPDLIISFLHFVNVITLLSIIKLKIPVFISERIDPNFHKLPKIYDWFRLKIYQLATKLIVQTKSASSYFPEKKFSNITIIPNPVKTPLEIKKKFLIKPLKIISVGRLDRQKDHKTLIHAFSYLIKQYPDLILEIYGKGILEKDLNFLIAKLGLTDKVFLKGVTEDIDQKLLRSDIFVFPSLYEGFPNALCEAMAVGLPVVASNCSGNVDVVIDKLNGRLFKVGDVNDLLKILKEILENNDQRKQISLKAIDLSKDYSYEKIFLQWEELIKYHIK
jgi:GalNAc-alpha-(1->4)-GalNAc-alpha-(1->3)-diNAcBac-PP-undecaprenol alpha-1,4-N-acetyl-D-galactosaminyltransferase